MGSCPSFHNMLSHNRQVITLFAQSARLTRTLLASKHTLPDLDYSYDALEPHVSGRIMELHHSKHHQTYVNNYNAALDQIAEAKEKGDKETVEKIKNSAVRFNGGGHHNHSHFWKVLTPKKNGGGEIPADSSPLVSNIASEWGSVKKFQETF